MNLTCILRALTLTPLPPSRVCDPLFSPIKATQTVCDAIEARISLILLAKKVADSRGVDGIQELFKWAAN